MSLIIHLDRISDQDRERVGGKGFALAMMARSRMNVPQALCITTEAYNHYVGSTGLRERILLELNRKGFGEMRWEEMWDASLRIRNIFLNTPIPADLSAALKDPVDTWFSAKAVVVRSSAPGEDSAKASFAGLHESYVNVRGTDAILEHIRLVWASLWSDAALLYRQELGLDVERSTMAVVVQEIVVGEQSGVAFGRSPNDESQAVIEAVYGLNQGLVDGTVEPDRWMLDRKTGEPISQTAAKRSSAVVPSPEGVRLEPLPPAKLNTPPLNHTQVAQVFGLVLSLERLFGAPQDVEWTFRENVLYVLQSRPITTRSTSESGDKRPWYLSLRRSFENLRTLRTRIQDDLIPAMIEEAAHLADHDLTELSDVDLAREIKRRSAIYNRWVDVYWSEFIPFAHGARLFGQVYNDAVRPSDPYEFMDLLAATKMASLERNRMLADMASMIRENPRLAEGLPDQRTDLDHQFNNALNAFLEQFGDLFRGMAQPKEQRGAIIQLLLEMANQSPETRQSKPRDIESLKNSFLSRFQGKQRAEAAELLDLARASYRLRDDDNIHLGRIEGQMLAAIHLGKERIAKRATIDTGGLNGAEVIAALKDPDYVPPKTPSPENVKPGITVKARQLVGQPAGPGIGKGNARVIMDPSDLFEFKSGEILVCDAVDPTMTFVVPISGGIVERRGGMLIHGAIIAREYGLPCVTGVPDAPSLIRTGDRLTVDGYLGLVILG
jgi:pyruvate,water dikinase